MVSQTGQAGTEIEITPEMIEAAEQVLFDRIVGVGPIDASDPLALIARSILECALAASLRR